MEIEKEVEKIQEYNHRWWHWLCGPFMITTWCAWTDYDRSGRRESKTSVVECKCGYEKKVVTTYKREIE